MSNALQGRIVERIESEGPITFAEYMRMALYEPGYGYYVTGKHKMGWEGDYFTSSDVSEIFAACVGRQLRDMWEQLDRPATFVVKEEGAGRGNLGRGVRAWAAKEARDLHAALVYHTSDIREGEDSSGRENIDKNEGEGPVTVLLSNELVDAFPVHRVIVYEKQLYEIYVDVGSKGELHEALSEPSTEEVGEYLAGQGIDWHQFEEGWQAEINLDALRWMRRAGRQLQRHGFLLTIDYGEKAKELYTKERPEGTLLCYYQHRANNAPLARPGEQDITAHVNFSALIDEGSRQGLSPKTFVTQREWLEACGIYAELEQKRTREFAEIEEQRGSDRGQVALLKWYDLRQRVRALTDMSGLGNFKVLILER